MELVEDHGSHPFQEGIGLEALDEDPLGDHQDPGGRSGLAIEAHLVADLLAESRAGLLGHAAGSGPGGDAAGLQHHDLPSPSDPRSEQGEGHPRRLAGAGGSDEDGGRSRAQGGEERGQDFVDGQGVQGARL